ncbi:uncharacterized protein LOC142231717 [Haematobia irritans]|uniref:uncharacterized protein LOC142231717 n=1 Tax=Haematobia irritans TaxID=7368 RepID=UPI003F505EAC
MANALYLIIFTSWMIILIINNYSTEAKIIDFSKDIKLQKHVKVHQCRHMCYLKTLNNGQTMGDISKLMNFNYCKGIPDCYMCYDYCEVLPKSAIDLAVSMCSDQVYCSKGCRIACDYHRVLPTATP